MQLWIEYYSEPIINYQFFFALLYYLDQDSGSIRSSCHIMPPKCSEKPCMHGGKCIEGWNRFICDCSSTSFTGPTCGRGMQRFFFFFFFSFANATTIFKTLHSIYFNFKGIFLESSLICFQVEREFSEYSGGE